MTKNKIEIIITLTLIPILIFIVYKNIAGWKGKRTDFQIQHPARLTAKPWASSSPHGEAVGIQYPEIITKGLDEEKIKRIKELNWARDPFLFGEAKIGEGGLVLNGIVWDEKSPSAIINDTVVRIGDEVDGNRVVDIQRERVILSKEANIYELNLQRRGVE